MYYIGYKPIIEYKDIYNSNIGTYKKELALYNDDIDEELDIDTTIEDNIRSIDVLLNTNLPPKLKDNISEVYKPLKDTYYNYVHGQLINDYNKDNSKYIDNSPGTKYSIRLGIRALTIKKGNTKTIRAFAIPTTDKKNKILKWESDNPNIASVNEDGIITGVDLGNTIIRVISTYGKSDECLVSVIQNEDIIEDDNKNDPDVPPNLIPDVSNDDEEYENKNNNDDNDFIVHVREVSLDRTNIIVKVGYERKLNVTIYPKNVLNKELVWSSTMDSIASVKNGIITGNSVGECIITVASVDGNKTDTCNVLVINDYISFPNPNPSGGDPELNPDSKPKPTPPEPIFRPTPNPSPDIDDDDDPDKPIVDPPIIIVAPNPVPKPTPSTVEDDFIKNMHDLIKFYTTKLKDSMGRYYTGLYSVLDKKDLNQTSFIYNNTKTSNKNIVSSYSHLLDTGIRQESLVDIKLDFFSSNFNFNQTFLHIKNFLTMYELRKKYETIPMSNGKDRESAMSNGILKANKEDISIRYDRSFENFYKYLNSSMSITNDIVDNIIQSLMAKGTLTEKGGI